jgi:CelD/BcsL family acetyltransferase involved in cellulose biosynthesis
MILVRYARPAEWRDWDQLVGRFPNCRIVHRRAWIEWLEACHCGTPLCLLVERDGEVVGASPGLVTRLGPLRLYGSPLPGWQTPSMGPVFDPQRIQTEELVAALLAFLEDRHGIHHVELLSDSLDGAAMKRLGFRPESVPTYRAQLYPDDEKRTFLGLKDSARRNVRRGSKLGLTIHFEQPENFVAEHYAQLREVFVRGGNTVSFGEDRVREFVRHMQAAGTLLAASASLPDGISIATGLFTIDCNELLLWSWAHRTQYRWFRPTELMTWSVMQRAMAAGCDTFDFMGLGDFKAKFGAELDMTKQRWVRSRYRWLTSARDLAERGYRWQQGVRGRFARMRMFGWRQGVAGAEEPERVERPA